MFRPEAARQLLAFALVPQPEQSRCSESQVVKEGWGGGDTCECACVNVCGRTSTWRAAKHTVPRATKEEVMFPDCCLHPRTRTREEDMVMSVVFEK